MATAPFCNVWSEEKYWESHTSESVPSERWPKSLNRSRTLGSSFDTNWEGLQNRSLPAISNSTFTTGFTFSTKLLGSLIPHATYGTSNFPAPFQ